jgi:hypothetical protein
VLEGHGWTVTLSGRGPAKVGIVTAIAPPSRRVAAAPAWAVCVVLAVASLVLIALGPRAEDPADLFGGVSGAAFVLLSLAFATVGGVICVRVPGNVVGPIFLATGLATGVGMAA